MPRIIIVCLRLGSVLADDDPSRSDRHTRTWLSHRDLIQLVGKALSCSIGFGVYYGVSENSGRIWDIELARREIGYSPVDNASRFVIGA